MSQTCRIVLGHEQKHCTALYFLKMHCGRCRSWLMLTLFYWDGGSHFTAAAFFVIFLVGFCFNLWIYRTHHHNLAPEYNLSCIDQLGWAVIVEKLIRCKCRRLDNMLTPPRSHIRRNSTRRYFQGLQLREYNVQESSSLDNKYDIRRKFRHHIADLSHSLCKTHNITTLCNDGLFETLKTKLRNFLPEKLTDRWEGNFQ